MSDAPDGSDATRGGMEEGDPGLAGATENGGTSLLNRPHGDAGDDSSSTELPGQKGGAAGGGG